METHQIRDDLTETLRAWEAGGIDETEVRDRAERLELAWQGWQQLDGVALEKEPPDFGAVADILTTLSDLHHTLVTPADVPAMLACLATVDPDPSAARTGWMAYVDSVDWEERGRVLRANPFYVAGD